MFKDTLRNMNLYVNGTGYAGVIDELTLPKLTVKTAEYRGGGMDAPIEVDMGMEKMEASFTLSKFDKGVITSFGLKAGNNIPLVIRGSILSEQDGSETPVVVILQGIVKEMDFGTWKAGEATTVKVTLPVRYYSLIIDDEELHRVDIANMTRIINGVDQLATTRKNIGFA